MPDSPDRLVAELDRRFYAFTLDRVIAWSVDGVVAYVAFRTLIQPGQVAAGIALIVATVLVVGAAFAVVLGLLGTSPGMALVGLRVVDDTTGGPIGIGRALLRQLVLGVATLPTFGLGVATLAWTAVMDPGGRRRGWHDHVAHSAVVDVRPVPVEVPEEDVRPRHVVNLTAMRLVPAPRAAPVATPARSPRPPAAPPPAAPPPAAPPTAAPPTAAPAAPPVVAPAPAPAPVAPGEPAAPAPPPAQPPRPATPQRQQLGYPLVPDAPAVVEAAPAPSVRWRVSFDSGESFVVEGLALVGRRPEPRQGEPVRHLVPLPSSDMSLSKTHAQVQVTPEAGLVVVDRGSTNGSILIRGGVAKELTAGRAATLLDGDHVRFGDREMTVARES
ncbi:LigA (Fragment) [Nocardioides sp. PD653]